MKSARCRRSWWVIVIVISFDGRVFNRAVHALDLAIGPRMIWLFQATLNVVSPARAVERMAPQHGGRTIPVFGAGQRTECRYRSERCGWRMERRLQALRGKRSPSPCSPCRTALQRRTSRCGLWRRKDRAFLRRLHFGDVDMEKADRIGIELVLRGLRLRRQAAG